MLECEQLEDRMLMSATPNIILITTDDQRYDTLSYMPAVTSQLVGGGVTYSNSFVTTPLCCPSRFSMLTGQYAFHHGVKRNYQPDGSYFESIGKDKQTLAVWLKNAGYNTGFFGKYLSQYDGNRVPHGWNKWSAALTDQYYGFEVVNKYLQKSIVYNHSTDYFAAQVNKFIDKGELTDEQPFFAWFAPRSPHKPANYANRHSNLFNDLAPWNPPNFDEADMTDKPSTTRNAANSFDLNSIHKFRRNQLRSLQAVDEAVASFITKLEQTGELENTVIIYTSDNGLFWGEHGLKNKRFPYEESIRVPLVIWEGWNQVGSVDDRLATNIDLAPTILEYAGVAVPSSVDGESLKTGTPRSDFLIECYRETTAALEFSQSYQGIRAIDWTYVSWKNGEEELYDLAADPYQLQNLVLNPTYIDQLNSMRERLGEFINQV